MAFICERDGFTHSKISLGIEAASNRLNKLTPADHPNLPRRHRSGCREGLTKGDRVPTHMALSLKRKKVEKKKHFRLVIVL